MSTSDNCKDGLSKSNDSVCDNMNDMLQNMSVRYAADDKVNVCANCGKEGEDVNNTCNKCEMVKYCNAVCKKKHKKKHKKDCEEHQRLIAEQAAKLHDEKLFKQPPPEEDCPICFLPLPSLETGTRYKTCCGKRICSGCSHAPVYDNQGNKVDNQKCAFCRTACPETIEEAMEREKMRVKADDPIAIYNLGCYNRDGRNGHPQDMDQALELFHRAGEFGYADAYCKIGYIYDNGIVVEVDKKKAVHYYELAAMKGDVGARYNLAIEEWCAGNFDRAMKHHMISIRSGCDSSLEMIKDMYSKGYATKEDYTTALRAYQEYLGEIKSPQRDKAAIECENCQYY